IILKIYETMDLYEELINLNIEGSIVEDSTIGLDIAIAAIKSAKTSSMINIKEISNERLKEEKIEEINNQYQKTLKKAEDLLIKSKV
ncbi:MAG: hypothetical protein L0I93_07715, partial [Atopostipes suicloacalis]|nr:hypothetical protein [Atopostipes suicloacalis]